MPALDPAIVDDLTRRLRRFLNAQGRYGELRYLTSGGSAAVYAVQTDAGFRAIKAFNPAFLNGPGGAAERKRLELQRKLIGHGCSSLVQTFRVEEAEGTAFTEMEFVDWPQLTARLDAVPDAAVVQLFTQLVAAVKYLDSMGIVHRDIKPENIHVAPDFSTLKLLDLGVVREVEQGDDAAEAAITDSGNLRPFLATAQYSSPEYLFRLDEPSPKLWKGLNFYQMGAVLHDLIMKRPIFHHEMGLGNRWLVARAVLAKVPSFGDGNPNRLANLKSLASRCLVKDLDSRLQLVSWEDFILEGAKDPLTTLRARLAKGRPDTGKQIDAATVSRLEFDRSEFFRRFAEMIRTELLPVCGTNMPLTLSLSAPGKPAVAQLLLTVDADWTVECALSFEWQGQVYERTAELQMQARLARAQEAASNAAINKKLVAVATIANNESETATSVAEAIAEVVAGALDRLEGAGDSNGLNGFDLLS